MGSIKRILFFILLPVISVIFGLIPTTASNATSTIPQVQHVVVLYFENQSFDHLFLDWCISNPSRCPNSSLSKQVTLSNNVTVTLTPTSNQQNNINHDGDAQVAAIANGLMNGWNNIQPHGNTGGCGPTYNYQCMQYEPQSLVPNWTSAASHFAIDDNMFSMSDSPSFVGHIYAIASSTAGFWGSNPWPIGTSSAGWGCDSGQKVTYWQSSPTTSLQKVPPCIPDYNLPVAQYPYGGAWEKTPVSNVPTILDELNSASLSWKIYGALPGQHGYGAWNILPTFAKYRYTNQFNNLVSGDQFFTDAANGTLPAFSVWTPGGDQFPNSCHNSEYITNCDNELGSLITAIQNSPNWSSTVVFITTDDFGGWYDSVPPPSLNPDGTQEGPRVPLIAVSPFAKPGFTDTSHATFASILAYVENVYGLSPLNVNDQNAYPLTNMFDYSLNTPKVKMVQRPVPASAKFVNQSIIAKEAS